MLQHFCANHNVEASIRERKALYVGEHQAPSSARMLHGVRNIDTHQIKALGQQSGQPEVKESDLQSALRVRWNRLERSDMA